SEVGPEPWSLRGGPILASGLRASYNHSDPSVDPEAAPRLKLPHRLALLAGDTPSAPHRGTQRPASTSSVAPGAGARAVSARWGAVAAAPRRTPSQDNPDRPASGQTGPPQDRQARLGTDRPTSGGGGGTDRPTSGESSSSTSIASSPASLAAQRVWGVGPR
ncbi:hypothetical protein T484DRAFT_1888352, partial [Baffinella frigidus]